MVKKRKLPVRTISYGFWLQPKVLSWTILSWLQLWIPQRFKSSSLNHLYLYFEISEINLLYHTDVGRVKLRPRGSNIWGRWVQSFSTNLLLWHIISPGYGFHPVPSMVRHPSCVTAMEGDFILPHWGTWKCTTLQILFIYIEYNLKRNKNKQNKIALVVCHNMRWGPLQVHHIPQRFTSIPSSPRTSEQDQKSNPMWSGLVSFWCWSKWMSTNIKYGMSHLLRQP